MRASEFRDWLTAQLESKDMPVRRFEAQPGGPQVLEVEPSPGTKVRLHVVRTSPPGGEDLSAPRTLVFRAEGAAIERS